MQFTFGLSLYYFSIRWCDLFLSAFSSCAEQRAALHRCSSTSWRTPASRMPRQSYMNKLKLLLLLKQRTYHNFKFSRKTIFLRVIRVRKCGKPHFGGEYVKICYFAIIMFNCVVL